MNFPINLEVKKETFMNYLVKLGFKYKIKQYDDFIESVQRKVFSDLKNSMKEDNLFEVAFSIFGTFNININIFKNHKMINSISSKYFREKIEDGSFELYFEETKNKFSSEETQEKAYYYILTKDIHLNNKKLFDTNEKLLSIAVKNCLVKNSFSLSLEKKNSIKNNVQNKILRDIAYGNTFWKKYLSIDKIFNRLDLYKKNYPVEEIYLYISRRLRKENLLSCNKIEISMDIIYSEEVSQKIASLVTDIKVIREITHKDNLEAFKIFRALHTGDCSEIYRNCNGKNPWDLFASKWPAYEYEKLLERRYSIENYKKPDLKNILFKITLNGKEILISLEDIENELSGSF